MVQARLSRRFYSTRIAAPRIYFWRAEPGNAAARAAVKAAAMRAFRSSRIGKRFLAAVKQAKRNLASARLVEENMAFRDRNHTEWQLYMRMLQEDVLTGLGTQEQLSVLHSWMGHLLHVVIERMKKLQRATVAYQELRQNSLPRLCRGRRALFNAWRRYDRTHIVGFTEPELQAFKVGFDECVLISRHAALREMRAAFAFGDKQAKTKGLQIEKAPYRY